MSEETPVKRVGRPPKVKADAPAPDAVESLDGFLRRVERAHIDRDVVAVAATHPQATEGVWPGLYSGIHLSAGPQSVTYSDGTTE